MSQKVKYCEPSDQRKCEIASDEYTWRRFVLDEVVEIRKTTMDHASKISNMEGKMTIITASIATFISSVIAIAKHYLNIKS